MRFLPILLLAGCSHATIDASSRTSTASAVILSGMFLAAAADDASQERSFPSFSVFSDWLRTTPAPQLDPNRRISEQDCSQPLDHSLGNIRCK